MVINRELKIYPEPGFTLKNKIIRVLFSVLSLWLVLGGRLFADLLPEYTFADIFKESDLLQDWEGKYLKVSTYNEFLLREKKGETVRLDFGKSGKKQELFIPYKRLAIKVKTDAGNQKIIYDKNDYLDIKTAYQLGEYAVYYRLFPQLRLGFVNSRKFQEGKGPFVSPNFGFLGGGSYLGVNEKEVTYSPRLIYSAPAIKAACEHSRFTNDFDLDLGGTARQFYLPNHFTGYTDKQELNWRPPRALGFRAAFMQNRFSTPLNRLSYDQDLNLGHSRFSGKSDLSQYGLLFSQNSRIESLTYSRYRWDFGGYLSYRAGPIGGSPWQVNYNQLYSFLNWDKYALKLNGVIGRKINYDLSLAHIRGEIYAETGSQSVFILIPTPWTEKVPLHSRFQAERLDFSLNWQVNKTALLNYQLALVAPHSARNLLYQAPSGSSGPPGPEEPTVKTRGGIFQQLSLTYKF